MNIKAKIDTKNLDRALDREVSAELAKKKFEVVCKNCAHKVSVPQGKSICPFCGHVIDLTLNIKR